MSIRVTHAGVNFKDIMARRGDPGYVPHWPFVPGLEVAGFIHAVGASVSEFSVGDSVVAFTGAGGLAEVAIADARLTVQMPHGLAPERAAAGPGALLTAALLISELGHLRPGEKLPVHSAAGAVGHAAAQLARLGGAELLLGTVGDTDRAHAARRGGYDTVFAREPDLGSAIRAATDGHGVDLILDPQGTTQPPHDGKRLAQQLSLAALTATDPLRVAATLRRVLDHLAASAVDLDVTIIDGLSAAAEAQQALAERRGSTKHVVI